MRSPFRRPAVIAVGLLLGLFVVANAGEMRTWTSKNGKAKIQAKLLSADKDKLTLEREDGKKIVVPLKDLSAADQKYVADNNDTDNPFNTPAEEGGAAGEPAVKEVDRSQERQVSLVPVKDKWAFTAPEKPAGAKAARGSGLPPIKDWEGIKWLAINGTGKTAAVGYLLAGGRFGSKEKGTTRLVLTDIETGKQKAAVAAEAQMVPLAVDDAGKRVVMCREVFGEGNRERLEIWEAEGTALKRAAAWLPYADEKWGPNKGVRWAAFVDDKQFLTLGNGGKVTLWDVDKLTPTYSMQVAGSFNVGVGLSPDRKHLAFAGPTELGILDVAAGEVVCNMAIEKLGSPNFSFSPSGAKLACWAGHRLLVWDFATGQLSCDMPLPDMIGSGPPAWAGEGHVILANTTLINLELQLKLWTFSGHEAVQSSGDTSWFVVADGTRSAALIPASLPHQPAADALKKAAADPNFFVVKQGVTVKLDLGGLPDEAGQELARKALTAKLEAIGCRVGDNGTVTLAASVVQGAERELRFTFRRMPNAPVRVVKAKEHFTRIKFVYQGQPVWELSQSNLPGDVLLGEGETLEDRMRKVEKPDYGYFERIGLPKQLTRTTGTKALGSTRLTTAGPR